MAKRGSLILWCLAHLLALTGRNLSTAQTNLYAIDLASAEQ